MKKAPQAASRKSSRRICIGDSDAENETSSQRQEGTESWMKPAKKKAKSDEVAETLESSDVASGDG